MCIFTMLVLALTGAFPIYIYALLAVCFGASAVIRYHAQGERRQKRRYLLTLLAVTLTVELVCYFSYNWLQYSLLVLLACCIAVLLGVVVGAMVRVVQKGLQ